MDRILVGVDGSNASAIALDWAAGLAGPLGAELIVATVWVPWQAELPPEEARAERDALRDRLEDSWCGPAAAAGVGFEAKVLEGDPPDALIEEADRCDATLLVVGARGTGGFDGLRLGSVAYQVAHRTNRPVAVVPEAAGAYDGVDRIVLGLDGSDDSLWPVGLVGVLAEKLGADVVAVNAQRPPAEWVPEDSPKSWHTRTMGLLEGAWTEPLRERGIVVRSRIEETNHATEALLAVAEETDADVIVVGTRSLTGWRLMRLGGTTMQLLHHSDRPVIVVPPPD